MHSHDRTLAQSLIVDPDRRTSKHDLVCQYLLDQAAFKRTFENVAPPVDLRVWMSPPVLEQPIVKGSGQYRTIVGFIDVFVDNFHVVSCTGHECPVSGAAYDETWETPIVFHAEPLTVEVKTTPTPIGEILRQVELYRQFVRGPMPYTLLVVTYDMSDREIAALERSGVFVRHVDPIFDAFEKATRGG